MFEKFNSKDYVKNQTNQISFFSRPTRGLKVKALSSIAGESPDPKRSGQDRIQVVFEVLTAQDGYQVGDTRKWFIASGHKWYNKNVRGFVAAARNVRPEKVTGAICNEVFQDKDLEDNPQKPAIVGTVMLLDVVEGGGSKDKNGNVFMNYYWNPYKEEAEKEVDSLF